MGCLPQAGGWFDQDSFLVIGMDMVIEEQKAREAEEQHKQELKQRRGR